MTYLTPRIPLQIPTHGPTKFKRVLAGLFITLPLLFASEAQAQRVYPMAYDLEPTGSSASENLTVENTSQSPMTIELFAKKIAIDSEGNETTVNAEDDFLIFPPQALIKAGGSQTVRIKYIGDPKIQSTNAYRISVKQVPIDMTGEGESGVGLVVNFNTLASVTPKGAKTELTGSNIVSKGNNQWAITVQNDGKKMARLSRTEWEFSDAQGNSKRFSTQEVGKMTQKNLIMPGKKLTLTIPAVEGLDATSSSVKIKTTS